MPDQIDLDGLDDDVRAFVEQITKENGDLADALNDATEALEKAKAEPETTEDDASDEDAILKGLPAEVQQIVKNANERAEQAEEIVKGERRIRLVAGEISKSSDTKLAVEHEVVGSAMVDVLEKCGQETYDALWTALNAAGEQVAKAGDITGEIGTEAGGSGSTPAESELEALAKAKMAEDNDLGYAAAVVAVASERPELYAEHLAKSRNTDNTTED